MDQCHLSALASPIPQTAIQDLVQQALAFVMEQEQVTFFKLLGSHEEVIDLKSS